MSRTSIRSSLAITALALSTQLLLGACGGSDASSNTAPTTSTVPVAEATPVETEAPAAPTAESAVIAAAVAADTRPEEDKVRDADRKPAEVLAFFGVRPGQMVADIMAGKGYYSNIVDHIVGDEGKVLVHNNAFLDGKAGPAIDALLPKLAHSTKVVAEMDGLSFEPASIDTALLFLIYHDAVWMGVDRAKMNKQIFDALKPGGILAVIDHASVDGAGTKEVKTLHRIEKKVVLDEILAAGFVLDAESDILSHPEDDHTQSVFAEGLRGKTDRFVLRFKKPE